MSSLRLRVEFPCGYKLIMEGHSGLFGGMSLSFDEKDFFVECPIHGNKCKGIRNEKN